MRYKKSYVKHKEERDKSQADNHKFLALFDQNQEFKINIREKKHTI